MFAAVVSATLAYGAAKLPNDFYEQPKVTIINNGKQSSDSTDYKNLENRVEDIQIYLAQQKHF